MKDEQFLYLSYLLELNGLKTKIDSIGAYDSSKRRIKRIKKVQIRMLLLK